MSINGDYTTLYLSYNIALNLSNPFIHKESANHKKTLDYQLFNQ